MNQRVQLKSAEFKVLSEFIHDSYGIQLPEKKIILLESRLQKRLKELNMTDFSSYCKYIIENPNSHEVVQMIDAVSTNKTDFYREPKHFDFLTESILKEHSQSKGNQPLKVWSAAASTGEEIYTIAMVIEEYNRLATVEVPYSILGTDISVEALKKAQDAIYSIDRVDVIPLEQKKRYLLKSKNKTNVTVRVNPKLRAKASYQRLNLMDSDYNIPNDMDLIFCRNVLIYFDKATQTAVVSKLISKLKPGGYLFIGHSESLFGAQFPLTQIKPTIFKKH